MHYGKKPPSAKSMMKQEKNPYMYWNRLHCIASLPIFYLDYNLPSWSILWLKYLPCLLRFRWKQFSLIIKLLTCNHYTVRSQGKRKINGKFYLRFDVITINENVWLDVYFKCKIFYQEQNYKLAISSQPAVQNTSNRTVSNFHNRISR